MASNVNTQIHDKVVDRAAMVRRYEEHLRGKVFLILDGHEVRVDKLLREAKTSAGGLLKLRKAIDEELQSTYKAVYQTSKRSLLDLVGDQLSFGYQNLEAAVSKVWRTRHPARSIGDEIVLERPLYKDKTLEAGWHGLSLGERQRLEGVIRGGLADGLSMEEIARNVRKGNLHNITRNQSRTLVATATTSVIAQADLAVYRANGKLLRGWQYVAVLDSRTTPVCRHRDTQVFGLDEVDKLPPAHYGCRSTTLPVVRHWEDLAKLEGVAEVRKRNIQKLSPKQLAFYDGALPLEETYGDWLRRQPSDIQLKHLGSQPKVDLFNSGQLEINKFSDLEGKPVGIRKLRQLTDSQYTAPGDTVRFAAAKQKLDSLHLGISRPEDLLDDIAMQNRLREYYELQAGQLDGTLSLTNYRGLLIGNKRATKNRVLNSPPTEDQLVYNPVTGRYDDVRLYQPAPAVLTNNLRLIDESDVLKPKDKAFIQSFIRSLEAKMSLNERAVVADNLRIIFTRYRGNPEPWANFKAVVQNQIKFDVMNVSDSIETQLRRDADVLKKLKQDNFIDPVLGATSLDEVGRDLVKNIRARNHWEDRTVPKIADELRPIFDLSIPIKIRRRLTDRDLGAFYENFARRLALHDGPERDQLAVALGRELYNKASYNGTRNQWYQLGLKLLDNPRAEKFYKVETFGVQKRRMKSREGGRYFGPYYDTLSYNLRLVDPRLQKYGKLTRLVELGLRVGVTRPENRLLFRKGHKTYFVKDRLGLYEDTRIPITSTSSFHDFPEELVDDSLVEALDWASRAQYRVDEDFYDAIQKLLYFKDDRGRAEYFDDLNEYRRYIASRGDAYERFKAMEYFRKNGKAFSNHPFVDHRARVYDRGLIGPQSGETFRPFLNTAESKVLGKDGFLNIQDQIGAFLGGLSDDFEGKWNSLAVTGRQEIAKYWRSVMVKIGEHLLRGKPNDIRAVLESKVFHMVEGEDMGKFLRLSMEAAKLDRFLGGKYDAASLEKLNDYRTALALEQDASSSGAQIIALTTRNKQLAELSNVMPTNQKRRLYDEIAAATFNDPRFRRLNERLGLTEKDLRKAAKAQNMVTFYGAGERTGILNVERKLSKALGKEEGTLVVQASDRDTVLNEISARAARVERFDPDAAAELKHLRNDVRDIFNKGQDPGDELMEQLWFLDPKTRDLVEKMSLSYNRVVTPADFQEIAMIMSEHLASQVPILKDFTRFFGRLAEAYLKTSKPSKAAYDWKQILKIQLLGSEDKGWRFPKAVPEAVQEWVYEAIGIQKGKAISRHLLEKLPFWDPQNPLEQLIYGVSDPKDRRTGRKLTMLEIAQLWKLGEIKILHANKLPKSWTNVPSVNFDGKVIEQNFTQVFEERLLYKDGDGNWAVNILQVPQKTEATWWEEFIGKDGKINDIANATKARTAFGVNTNHSNDAVIVKKFHQWGKKSGIPTSSIHDAFFANAADMLKARGALRGIYAEVLQSNVIKMTLEEMRKRGLPKDLYEQYLEEAIKLGLIPIPGKSVVGGKVITKEDILRAEDVLSEIQESFNDDRYWYGVG